MRAEPGKVAVAGADHDRVDVTRERDGVEAHPEVPVGLLRAVSERFDLLNLRLEADVAQRLEEALFLGESARITYAMARTSDRSLTASSSSPE